MGRKYQGLYTSVQIGKKKLGHPPAIHQVFQLASHVSLLYPFLLLV
jgi:hypothetical protein